MKDLDRLRSIEDPVKKRALFVAILSKAITDKGGAPPIVVGGEAVELYTQGSYTTGDIDLIAPIELLESVLAGWGFEKTGRLWLNKEFDLYIDWRGEKLGGKPPETIELSEGLSVMVISAEDLVLDRLNAAKWWKDTDSLMWARVILNVKKTVGGLDVDYLKKKAEEEGVRKLLEEIFSTS